MTKIQFIIDDEKSLRAYTCTEVDIETPTPSHFETMLGFKFKEIPQCFHFTARNIITDDSPTLISLPDELLLRIRDYNIDAEHQYAIEQTFKLNEKNSSLAIEIKLKEAELEFLYKQAEVYHKKLSKLIDKYPEVAAEIALERGDLDIACHFANKASKKRRKKK